MSHRTIQDTGLAFDVALMSDVVFCNGDEEQGIAVSRIRKGIIALEAEIDRLTTLAEIGAAVSKISEYDTACLKFERQHRPNKVVEQWSIEAPDPCYYDGDCYEPIVSSYGVTLEDALTEAWLMENNND